MQTASRDSLAAAVATLDEAADGASTKVLSATADELLAVGRLLAREPVLRRSLADPAAPAEVRRELLDAIAGDGFGSTTTTLLHAMVSSRWSTPNDLVEAGELLAVQALLAAAQKTRKLADVEDELFRFLRLVAGDQRLRAALNDVIAGERRQQLVEDLLVGKAQPVTVALVRIALAGLGGRMFEPSLERLIEYAAQRRDREVAYVTVAAALSTEQEQRLEASLSRTYGQQMSLLVTVDPSILGGMAVRVRQELYDGSIDRRLKQVRGALAG
ncbi:MAG: F0F1 ATP synthase subunit delta [Pseudonocardiales bacterium]|nr:MAG: F0F1 ATP synthase subunit delta [Pseudonocardiales bacterium]